MSAVKPFASAPDPLKHLRQKVQVLRRQVPGLADEETWRDFLALHAGGERSTRAMNKVRLDAVVHALYRAGAPKTRAKAAGDKRFPYTLTPTMRAARALWIEGAKSSAIRDRTDRALASFIKGRTGIEMGAVPAPAMMPVIEAIKEMVARGPDRPGGGGE